MTATPRMQRVVRKFKLGEEPLDCEYWLTKSMPERLDALLDLINEHHGWTDETQPRLQRVLVVAQQQ